MDRLKSHLNAECSQNHSLLIHCSLNLEPPNKMYATKDESIFLHTRISKIDQQLYLHSSSLLFSDTEK
jgi:hypothetical protein